MEKGSGLGGEHGGGNLDLVIELGTGEQFEAGAESAAFWVVGCIDQARDARLDDGSGAHGARFEGNVKSGFCETVVCKFFSGFPNDHDLGVRGRVAIADGAVAATRKNFPAVDKDGADGNFARFGTCSGLFQRDLHEFRIVHRCVVENITLIAR